MDADVRCSSGSTAGRSGEARGKDSRLNPGGLTVCRAIRLPRRQRRGRDGEKSAEAVVARLHRGPPLRGGAHLLTGERRAEFVSARSRLKGLDWTRSDSQAGTTNDCSSSHRRSICATTPAAKAEPDLRRARSCKRSRRSIKHEP